MIRIALMASGEGSNALALIAEAKKCRNLEIVRIIVDRATAPMIAKKWDIPIEVIEKEKSETRNEHEKKILSRLKDIDWIFLAGYKRLLTKTLLSAFPQKIINIHPSLLPDFPGMNAYERAFVLKHPRCGASVHFVDEGIDSGAIIDQVQFSPPLAGEVLSDFSARGKSHEWKLYCQILRRLDKTGKLNIKRDVAMLVTQDEKVMQIFFLTGGDAALLYDRINQKMIINPRHLDQNKKLFVRTFLPGVTDNTASSVKELTRAQSAHTGLAWWEDETPPRVEFNPLIHRLYAFEPAEIRSGALEQISFQVKIEARERVAFFELSNLNERELLELSDENHWALSVEEMQTIKKFFGNKKISDVEIEIIAQTWSEHCKHKIFNAKIEHSDDGGKTTIDGLFKTFIKAPTEAMMKTKPWLISIFHDNAGIVRFSEKVDVCLKVETHNSPSALDPYGGALTGILGVNRDILGTGLGAKPIANLDVFCTGEENDETELPLELKKPNEILAGIHRGVMDGGNKSGIPTVTGAMCFDETFSGKPLVFCGTLGVMPQMLGGLPSSRKDQKPGDRIVVAGGAVGLDGIHGATASSREMDDRTPAGMVQIGDPFTQKRLSDFLLEARDRGLYSSLTDNGAGGLSSSIGEMAQLTNGARIDTAKVPLKYLGLVPWQIMVSESQERMSFAVPVKDIKKFMGLAQKYNVAAHDIGEFTDDGKFHIVHDQETVGSIDLNFLHNGLPQMHLYSSWAPKSKQTWAKKDKKERPKDWFEAWKEVLSDPTIASKEKWIRRYDHEVQAASVIKPFEGMHRTAPNDGAVIALAAHGGKSHEAVAMAVGLAPRVSTFDPKLMTMMALDEAVRGVIACGADPESICLLDNYCWPNPLPADAPKPSQTLGELVRSGMGLGEYVQSMQMPFISGKDSMKNDFKGKMKDGGDVHIRVLPTMLATALGKVPDLAATCKPHAGSGHKIYLLGHIKHQHDFGFYPQCWSRDNQPFEWSLDKSFALYKRIHLAIKAKVIVACHDLSEGGLSVALFEMLLLNGLGISVDFSRERANIASLLFAEFPGRFLAAVENQNVSEFERSFTGEARAIGVTTDDPRIELVTPEFKKSISISELERAWRES